MSKAIFLDRDGTINIDRGYVHKIEDFEFLPNAIAGLRKFATIGYKLIMITSQSGIGRGLYTEEHFHELMKHMEAELAKEGITFDGVYYCPHHPDAGCACRKPSVEMLRTAAKEHDIELKRSVMIGDKISDIEMGYRAGCKTILVKTGAAGTDGRHAVKPDYVAEDLLDAAKWVEQHAS